MREARSSGERLPVETRALHDLCSRGVAIRLAVSYASLASYLDRRRGYVLQTGQIVLADTTQALLKNPLIREAYLGELT